MANVDLPLARGDGGGAVVAMLWKIVDSKGCHLQPEELAPSKVALQEDIV